jgi:hypothetical protein
MAKTRRATPSERVPLADGWPRAAQYGGIAPGCPRPIDSEVPEGDVCVLVVRVRSNPSTRPVRGVGHRTAPDRMRKRGAAFDLAYVES